MSFNRTGAVPKNWRCWKKGKQWVYGCSLVFLGLGAIVPMVCSISIAHAEEITVPTEGAPPIENVVEDTVGTLPVPTSPASSNESTETSGNQPPVQEELNENDSEEIITTINPVDYGLPADTHIVLGNHTILLRLPEGIREAQYTNELNHLREEVTEKGYTLEIVANNVSVAPLALTEVTVDGLKYQIDTDTHIATVLGTTLTGNIEVLDIPSTITVSEGTFTVKRINSIRNVSIGRINIPGTITFIGGQAFFNSTIRHVSFEDNSNETLQIGNESFASCGIEVLDLRNTKTIFENRAFSGNELTTLTLPEAIEDEDIKSMAFENNQLSTINFPSTWISVGRGGDGTFKGNKLAELVIPETWGYIGSSVFSENEIESLIFNNNNLVLDNYVFAHNNLTSIDIPNTVILDGHEIFSHNRLINAVIHSPNSITQNTFGPFNYNLGFKKLTFLYSLHPDSDELVQLFYCHGDGGQAFNEVVNVHFPDDTNYEDWLNLAWEDIKMVFVKGDESDTDPAEYNFPERTFSRRIGESIEFEIEQTLSVFNAHEPYQWTDKDVIKWYKVEGENNIFIHEGNILTINGLQSDNFGVYKAIGTLPDGTTYELDEITLQQPYNVKIIFDEDANPETVNDQTAILTQGADELNDIRDSVQNILNNSVTSNTPYGIVSKESSGGNYTIIVSPLGKSVHKSGSTILSEHVYVPTYNVTSNGDRLTIDDSYQAIMDTPPTGHLFVDEENNRFSTGQTIAVENEKRFTDYVLTAKQKAGGIIIVDSGGNVNSAIDISNQIPSDPIVGDQVTLPETILGDDGLQYYADPSQDVDPEKPGIQIDLEVADKEIVYQFDEDESESQSVSDSESNSLSESNTTSESESTSTSESNSLSESESTSMSESNSLSESSSTSESESTSTSESNSLSESESTSMSESSSLSESESTSASESNSLSESESTSVSESNSLSESSSTSESESTSTSESTSLSESESTSASESTSLSESESTSVSESSSLSESSSTSESESTSASESTSLSESESTSVSESNSLSESSSTRESESTSTSESTSLSESESTSVSESNSLSESSSTSESESTSTSESESTSVSESNSLSESSSTSESESTSTSESNSLSESESTSMSESSSLSESSSTSESGSASEAINGTTGYSSVGEFLNGNISPGRILPGTGNTSSGKRLPNTGSSKESSAMLAAGLGLLSASGIGTETNRRRVKKRSNKRK